MTNRPGKTKNHGKSGKGGRLATAHRLNKATILRKAAEYIEHLEEQNRSLEMEKAALESKVKAARESLNAFSRDFFTMGE